jgi:streptomycin 6-kinase
MGVRPLSERIEERVRLWGVAVEDTLETPSSFVVFGRRGESPVVLKVLRGPGDEWRCGEVLEAFGGRGTVRVYEYVEGAVLLERLSPGTPLAAVALAGRDEEATRILAEVIGRMSRPAGATGAFVTARDWGEGFRRYLASGDRQIPADLVEQGRHIYLGLCASERGARLLHGDLQHYNVLFDAGRGWVAVDPKGVVGEVEYEIGAALRNPYERPELFASPGAVERRLRRFEAELKLDARRALAWGFAQAVLSAIWSVEDGGTVGPRNPSIMLADAIRPLL